MSIVTYVEDVAWYAIRCNECGVEGSEYEDADEAERQWENDGNEIFDNGRYLCVECAHPNPAIERVTERHNDNVMRFAGGGL